MTKTTMQIQAKKVNYDAVMEFVIQQADNIITALSSPEAHEIIVAVGEIVFNVLSYAYEPGQEGDILIECLHNPEKRTFQAIIRDNGRPFDPVAWLKGESVRSVMLCGDEIKGIGLMIARKFASDLRYMRENDLNILTVTKHY